jgi:Ca2+-binding EF-hand superfamily protein
MKITGDQIDDIEELFDRADEDQDDQISLTEFRGLMRSLDDRAHDTAIAIRFREVDTNRDGRISFTEFRSWWLNGRHAQ